MPTLSLPPLALRALATRAFVLWVLVHAFAFIALSLIGGPGTAAMTAADAARPNPLWVTLVCVALLMADTRRRGERVLWANLGISTTQLAALGAVVCVVGETLLAVALR